ncbi:hypothetical protein M231_07948, partial [Tremella mesenterica]
SNAATSLGEGIKVAREKPAMFFNPAKPQVFEDALEALAVSLSFTPNIEATGPVALWRRIDNLLLLMPYTLYSLQKFLLV